MKTRKGQNIMQHIEKIDSIIQSMKSSTAVGGDISSQLNSDTNVKTAALMRPATPVGKGNVKANNASEQACILLQRLLRGRAVQAEMQRGLRDCTNLIEEVMAPSVNEVESSASWISELLLGPSGNIGNYGR
jgi:hypothetical protein